MPPLLAAFANHIWQSTIVLVGIWIVMHALHANRAAIRHRLWLVASAKFLLPLAAVEWIRCRFGAMVPSPSI